MLVPSLRIRRFEGVRVAEVRSGLFESLEFAALLSVRVSSSSSFGIGFSAWLHPVALSAVRAESLSLRDFGRFPWHSRVRSVRCVPKVAR